MMLMVFKAYQKPYKLIKKSNFRGVKILQNTFIHIPGIGKETEAKEIIDMVSNYVSDAHHFEKKGDLVNAFAALT